MIIEFDLAAAVFWLANQKDRREMPYKKENKTYKGTQNSRLLNNFNFFIHKPKLLPNIYLNDS